MNIQEICRYVENILSSNEPINNDQLEIILSSLYKIIQQQDEMMVELKNSCIRLENNINLVENKISQYTVYKELCENILDRINSNPLSALLFLYKIKRKIEQYNSLT